MTLSLYRYRFIKGISLSDVRDSLVLSVWAAEGLHGRASVQLEAAFELDRKQRACVVDAGTLVGQTIARIFTSLLARQFGEDAFTVERGAKPGGQGKSQPSPRSA